MNIARALIYGSKQYPNLEGVVFFNQRDGGVWVTADIVGLPVDAGICGGRFFGFHIHSGTSCTGTPQDPFADADGHYNPGGCEHPHHAGDLPPLLGVGGHAYSAFLTNRFSVDEIIGRVVIIHANPDDFNTQPSGNSGPMIACGLIQQSATVE